MVPNCIGTRIGNKLVEVLNLFCVSGTHLIFYTENVFLNAFYRMVNGNDRSPPQAPPENKNRVGFSRKHYFFQRLRRFLCKKYQENLLFLKWIKFFKKPLKWINPRWDPPHPQGGFGTNLDPGQAPKSWFFACAYGAYLAFAKCFWVSFLMISDMISLKWTKNIKEINTMHLQSPWIFREISFVNITLWFWDGHRIMFSRSPQSALTNGKFRLTRWKRP